MILDVILPKKPKNSSKIFKYCRQC